MSAKLEDLHPDFLPLAVQLLDALRAEIPDIQIITTRRSNEAQADAVKRGVSWTTKSPHLDGMAIDVAPAHLMSQKNWAPGDPLWHRIGEIGTGLGIGLIWGGTWRADTKPPYGGNNGRMWDPGHFQSGAWKPSR